MDFFLVFGELQSFFNMRRQTPQFSSSSSSRTLSDSDDEKGSKRLSDEAEKRFVQILLSRGLVLHQALPDGNCLFRSVADQMYGDQSFHDVVREATMNWMVKERDFYSQYISEDFETYVARKRKDRVFGNHVEMQAISELYNRRIEVYDVEEFLKRPDSKPRNLFQSDYKSAPIRLSYHNRNHYNSIFDPNDPRIGEGLLPGFKTREQIEADLIKRVKDMTDADAVELELRRVAEQESVKEDDERFLKELEERQVRELLMNTRNQDVMDYEEKQVKELLSMTRPTEYDVEDYEMDYSSDSEERLIERVKWESLKEQ